jgi:hypothetical protein
VTVALVVIGLLVLTGWAILLWILRQPDASDVHADGFRTLDGSAIGATTYADVFVRAGVSTVQFTESMRRVNLALAGALPSMRRLTDALARAQELDAVARSLRRQGICPDCRGSGLDLDRSIAGHVKVRDALSLFTEANPPPECPECLGSGRVTVVYVVAFQHREQGEVGPTWLVNGPYHPLWSWWYVSCISLRDVPGVPPANKRYPEAEYELIVFSLNPDPKPPRPKVPDLDALAAGDATRGLPGFLHPPDVVFQFHGVSEQQAEQILELAVDRIVAGQSCDSDFRSWWTAALESTVEHYRNGRHA